MEAQRKVKDEVVLSPGRVVWNRLKRNKLATAGLIMLVIIFLICWIGPLVAPYTSDTKNYENTFAAPTIQHLMGTDDLGRDIFVRVMIGGRISLAIGIVAVLIEVVIGCILGVVAGYYGGIADGIIMRIVDVFMCFPFLPLLIMLGAVMSDLGVKYPNVALFRPENRIFMVMIILGILDWPFLCRMVRGQILTLREQEYMQAAEALGLTDKRKMFNHLLPNTFPVVIVSATLGIAGAILSETMLSFLGLGVMPPTPSWGNMIQVTKDMYNLQYRSWLWAPPGACIFLTVMSINLFGDGLRDALDPKLKR